MQNNLKQKINFILPQTQCGKCEFSGCEPYAEAISEGKADINQCPPGGKSGILKIAKLLKVDYKPLNERYGIEKPKEIAIIEEDKCIGCTLCILACPVDAILGASKNMHTVITEECTGCELCIAPCPVDCIKMIPLDFEDDEITKRKKSDLARKRYEFKKQRMIRDKNKAKANRVTSEEKKQAIANAMARIKKG
jgi:electron transport complex protein RnfB